MRKIIINNLYKASNLAFLALPFIYGCNGGGSADAGISGSTSVASLFSPETLAGTGTTFLSSIPDAGSIGMDALASIPDVGSLGIAALASVPDVGSLGIALASVPDVGVSSGIPTMHNPEPATMLLLGGGMLAMGFVKSRMRASKHS